MKTEKQITREGFDAYKLGGVAAVIEYGEREGLGFRWCERCGTDVPSVDADTCLACGCGGTERTNTERAAGARRVLAEYKVEALGESGPVMEDDVADFLTDLIHLCKREDWDFDAMLERGRDNFEVEDKR